MAHVWIDIEDASGTKLGDGPITTATGWENHRLLDRAGTVKFGMPASDPRAALLQEKCVVRCWTDTQNGPREVGAGIVDTIETDLSGAVPMLAVSGPDILYELANRSVDNLSVREQVWTMLTGHGAVWNIASGGGEEYGHNLTAAYDGNPATHTAADIECDSHEWLYVGFDTRFEGIRFDFYTPNTDSCTLEWQYFNGTGWASFSVTDGTATGGVPFHHDGDVTFTRPTDWQRCTPTGSAGSWFWVRVRATDENTSLFALSEIEVRADTPTTDGISQIMAYAPAGWSVSGYSTTAAEAYLQFTGESVLEALTRLAEVTGEHFRLGEGRQVVWLRADAPLSGVRAIRASDSVVLEANTDVCLVKSLRCTRDATELMTRIIPYGAGLGGTRITLALTTRDDPVGYQTDRARNYIRSLAGEATYGQIERVVQFQNVLAQQGDSLEISPKMAANQLFDAALAYLQARDVPIYRYSLEVIQTAAALHVGQTLHCVYQEWVDGYLAVNVDTYSTGPLHILGLTESIEEDGVFVVGLELATERVPALDDAGAVIGAIQSLRGAVGVGADGGGGSLQVVLIDSHSVDGFHAAATPTPGMLLALGVDGRFPSEALPALDLSLNAGAGLTWDGSALNVGAGTGISVGADAVALDIAADLTWTGDHQFQGGLVTRHILPEAPDTYDLGSTLLPWRKGHISELDAVVFAEEMASLVGGWLVVPHDQGVLAADVAAADTTVDFGKAMTAGDFVCLRGIGAVEYMEVGSLVSGTVYNVTRDIDGSGANDWPAGTVYLVLGQSGDGRIELNAQDSPRISVLQQGATYNAQSEAVRIGALNGSFGISSELYGFGIGDYAGNNYMRYEPTSGFLLQAGSGGVTIDATGITIGADEDQALRLANGAGQYSTIYDSTALLGAGKGGLGLFSSSQYWAIVESGGAKVAMDGGSGGFLKLQPRGGSDMAIGIGDAANNYVMLVGNSNSELEIDLGTGAEPTPQFKFAPQYTGGTVLPRVTIIQATAVNTAIETIATNVQACLAVLACEGYSTSSANIVFSADRNNPVERAFAGWVNGPWVGLNSSGELYVKGRSGYTNKFVGIAFLM